MKTLTLSNGKVIYLEGRLQDVITDQSRREGLMTTEEVAARLRVGKKYVDSLHRKGFLGRAIKRGKRVYFDSRFVEKYDEARYS